MEINKIYNGDCLIAMYQNKNLKIINADCMDIMKEYEDDYFDLAIVDPPYGMDIAKDFAKEKHKGKSMMKGCSKKEWDNEIPSKEYFVELKRVSKNQIIWGGNYFLDYLSATRCFVVWDKQNGTNNMADCEIAWTSFSSSIRMYRGHIFKGIGCTKYKSIHPTQKPRLLYDWILKKYGDKEFKIIDTHLGSGSSAIASYYFGCKEFVGIEIDEDYYNSSIKRIKQQTAQIKLF